MEARHFFLSEVAVKVEEQESQRECFWGEDKKEWVWQLVISATQYPGFVFSKRINPELQLVHNLVTLPTKSVSKESQLEVVAKQLKFTVFKAYPVLQVSHWIEDKESFKLVHWLGRSPHFVEESYWSYVDSHVKHWRDEEELFKSRQLLGSKPHLVEESKWS